MKKLLRVTMASAVLLSSTSVFAEETDKSSDIRRQILELTKELAETSKTDGKITYNTVETNCNYVVGTATNNYDYPISIQPYVIARDENGDIIFTSDATYYHSVDAGETIMFETNTYKDISNATYEFGSYTEPTRYTAANEKVTPVVTESDNMLRIEFESELQNTDDINGISVYVLYYKDDKVIDIESEWYADFDDVVTIKYEEDDPYDRYEVYLNVSCW